MKKNVKINVNKVEYIPFLNNIGNYREWNDYYYGTI